MSTQIIDKPGWYLISTAQSAQIFTTVIRSLCNPSNAEITIYKTAYYYPKGWPVDSEFAVTDWYQITDINDPYYSMAPNLGYWILIESFSVPSS
tara:strand:+ start:493 stop:774 length:282 start_codon:yes stop_codon:yes gene_type:complete